MNLLQKLHEEAQQKRDKAIHMHAIWFAWYNWGRKHETIKCTSLESPIISGRFRNCWSGQQNAEFKNREAELRMRFRKLRITFSVACGVLGILLIALWVRSYWRADRIGKRNNNNVYTAVGSINGTVYIERWKSKHPGPQLPPLSWQLWSRDAPGWTPPFQWTLSPDVRIQIPYPSLVLPILAAGIIPWLRLSHRFSLRTLLFAMTVIAVAIVFATYLAK